METPERNTILPKEIPFKENLCVVAGYCLTHEKDITPFITNTTDVLRVATYISGGDVSLAQNTKFKSFPRSQRKALVGALENVIKEEDVARHANKWVKLFHCLHVGDYSQKVYDIAKKVRENIKIETFNGKVELALSIGDVTLAVKLLKTRPSEFARRLDHLLRLNKQKHEALVLKDNLKFIENSFYEVMEDVPTKILLQLMGHFQNRGEVNIPRIILPKGKTQQAFKLVNHEPMVCNDLFMNINMHLTKKI